MEYEELKRKIEDAEMKGVGKPAVSDREETKNTTAQIYDLRFGMRMSMELVGGGLVGGFLGFGLDKCLNTKPLLLILLFVLGVAAGFYNIFKLVQKYDSEMEAQQKSQYLNETSEKGKF